MFKSNSKTIFPYLRLPFIFYKNKRVYFGGLLAGADKLGLFNYQILGTGLSTYVSLQSTLLRPFQIYYNYYADTSSFMLSKTIYQSPRYLLQSISMSVLVQKDSVYPNIQTVLRKHNYEMTLRSDISFHSNSDFELDINQRYVFKRSQFSYRYYYTRNMVHHAPFYGFNILAGSSKENMTHSISYTRFLYPFNESWWYWNLYSGDLFGRLYVDFTSVDDGYMSYGMEFLQEIAGFNNFYVVRTLGVSSLFGFYIGVSTLI